MNEEIDQIKNIFDITDEQAKFMYNSGFRVENINKSIDKYIENQVNPITSEFSNKINTVIRETMDEDD